MLLERIDVDSCGSLEHVQLGPFSHRLNAVYGPDGSGKTTTIEFVRSIMLGTDHQWFFGSSGNVVWSDQDGLLRCRRESDGTRHGRLMVDHTKRNGQALHEQYGYRNAENYHRLNHRLALPRVAIHALVAPSSSVTLEEICAACRDLDITDDADHANHDAIDKVRSEIRSLDDQLRGYQEIYQTRGQLVERRQTLVDYLAHLDRMEQQPPANDAQRKRLVTSKREAEEEAANLRAQESDLRSSLSIVEREIAKLEAELQQNPTSLPIAAARRAQLESIDRQLVTLCKTLRDIRGLKDYWSHLDSSDLIGEPHVTRFYPQANIDSAYSAYRSRLQSIRRHLDWLNRAMGDEILKLAPNSTVSPTAWVFRPNSLGKALESDHTYYTSLIDSIRGLVDALESQNDPDQPSQAFDTGLSASEETLSEAVRKLIDTRQVLIQHIAHEHGLSLNQLIEAFGDWKRCQDQPHLYQWLLSDVVPPKAKRPPQNTSRLDRFRAEREFLIDELNRTANRLDNLVSDIRNYESRLRHLPVYLPVVVDDRKQKWLQDELADLERQLRWLDSRHTLNEEREQLNRRLHHLLANARRPSDFLSRARYWSHQIAPGQTAASIDPVLKELVQHGTNRHYTDQKLLEYGTFARSILHLALRMSASEQLQKRGKQVPLLVDDPFSRHASATAPTRMANVLAQYTATGNQLVIFTSNRGFVEEVSALGGKVHTLSADKLYQLRYRDPRSTSTTSTINREFDTAWREQQGVFDDPHWYQTDSYRQQRNTFTDERKSSQYSADVSPSIWVDNSIPDSVSHYNYHRTEESRRVKRGPASPFFLTEDSHVDQAPSIDAVAAERLRCIGITTVGQLLAADFRSVASELNLADVTAKVVRRWQDESRLVCQVPQLRNFDARILVGCGFRSPRDLKRMEPNVLLQRVEEFLATKRGRQLLSTGTSYELSRITSWIASANYSHPSESPKRKRNSAKISLSSKRASKREELATNSMLANFHSTRNRNTDTSRGRAERRRSRGRSQGSTPATVREHIHRVPSVRNARNTASFSESVMQKQANSGQRTLKFYLDLDSPVVDAPSIGEKTAAKLRKAGYRSVRQFCYGDAEDITSALNHPRITAERIRTWQRQAKLMCQVPMLRGHDAQLLVAANIDDPEQLAECDPQWLMEQISPLARSSKGKRILRGATAPDLDEVCDWVEWAKSRRSLKAA